MVGTIEYSSVNTQNWESTKDTGLGSLFDTCANSWDVLFRDCTTNYCGIKLEGLFCVCIHWLKVYFTVTVLTTTTRLFCILAVYINGLCKGLFVSNLWSANVRFNVELTKQTVYDDLQMKLAHTRDDSLTSLLVCLCTEGWILLCKFCQRLAHLALTSFGLWLDRDIDNWLREYHGFQDYRMLLITDGITSCCVLETNSCSDISGINLV